MRNRKLAAAVMTVVAALMSLVAMSPAASAAGQSGDGQQVAVRASRAAQSATVDKVAGTGSVTLTVRGDAGAKVPAASHTCRRGYLCTYAKVSGTWGWHDFYRCGRHYLSYWSGVGLAYNNQTGGAVSYLYGQSGQRIGTIPPDGYLYAVNWDPVWSIGVC